ncbi:MAG: thiamine diphosphokinase [Acidimicrobiales bacterium]
MVGRRALVIASGADPVGVAAAGEFDLVVCADGGLDVARAAGCAVDLVVGDLDSVTPEGLAAADAAGIRVERHRVDKDESDLELALAAARGAGADCVEVHLANGGRLDHQLVNVLVLGSDRWIGASIEARVGEHRIWVVRGAVTLPLDVGDPVALVAVGGVARGIVTTGLAYELADEDLDPAEARGIANRVTGPGPTVTVTTGVLLAISGPER